MFLSLPFNGNGQVLECRSPEPTPQEVAAREARIKEIKRGRVGGRLTSDYYTFVPIRFHVIRRSNGTGGATGGDVNNALLAINREYRQSGLQFYLAGSGPHYINSNTFYDYEYSEEDDLTQVNDVNDAVNVYVVGTLNFQSSNVTGYAYYPSVLASSNRVFVRADRLADGRTLPHELGHYFNLLHTFYNNTNPNVSLRELVTRTAGANCDTAGDLLCDTPADPYGLVGANTSGCSYTGTVRDANGDLYQPALNNMMSYYYLCGNSFTAGQYDRIQDGLLLRTASNNEYTLDFPALPLVPTQLIATQTSSGVQVTFSDPGSGESGFILERSVGNAASYTPIVGLNPDVTAYLDATVSTNTLYYYRVRVANGVQYSAEDTAMVDLFYCKPSYSSPCSPVYIADFLLTKNAETLVSRLNSGCGTASYSDFTSAAAPVVAGQNYSFTARAVSGGNGTFFPQHLSIWLDANANGIFEASELLFQSTSSNNMSPNVSGSISIPASAAIGPTRLRVRSRFRDEGLVEDPCGPLQFGEAEDYTLNIQAPGPAPTTLDLKVLLEGAYRANTGLMITTLNQRGLLPGQTPVGSSATATPPGQPYQGSPWNYTGSESVSNYQANAVDWVLVSLRANSPSVNNTVFRTAALVLNNGQVAMIGTSPNLPEGQAYYIVIEHRNHLGVLSETAVPIQNGTLSYDFTTQNSYTDTNPISVGQKQIGMVFAMHCCDGNKNLPDEDFVINASDYLLWLSANGAFDIYSKADFDMDAQISAFDKLVWNTNNGKFTLVGRQ
ncbi:GEVED domain-containing protein [Persicitalea jodogahamensis]|uniref:Fibronectin type-III domain-containing protein n=1 Tax=Persicitalea jodogahamensis TaxID=402147 RepID=A0A8J3G9N9_9BACT|nr:GEVED domain-containing protein [Persicitalea jodogahamensis]GHB76705.1 hypothetical protein GCM10007390_33340 [Persicitalea jodogahamensis]